MNRRTSIASDQTGYGYTHNDLSKVGQEVAARQTEQAAAQRATIDEAAAALRAEAEARKAETLEAEKAKQAAVREQRAAHLAQREATLRADAREHYIGTDASFEFDWPAIRSKLNADLIAEERSRQHAAEPF